MKNKKVIVNEDGIDISPIYSHSKGKHHDIYLLEHISNLHNYSEVLNVLNRSTEQDSITLHLNNFGGYLHTAVNLVNCINLCKASIRVYVEGPLYSAAPIIALAGAQKGIISICPYSFFMFHDYSATESGKGNEIHKSVLAHQDFFKDFFIGTCTPFLTVNEVDSILSGNDLYVPFATSKGKNKKKVKGIIDRFKHMDNIAVNVVA